MRTLDSREEIDSVGGLGSVGGQYWEVDSEKGGREKKVHAT